MYGLLFTLVIPNVWSSVGHHLASTTAVVYIKQLLGNVLL